MNGEAAGQGWWRASDGYWYPPEARPGELWTGRVIGPYGEEAPGPGWWLANDYQWYPPEARSREVWTAPMGRLERELGADRPAAATRRVPARAASGAGESLMRNGRSEADFRVDAVIAAIGTSLILLGVVLLSVLRIQAPEAATALRLAAWSPVAIGSAVTLVAAVRYFDVAR